MPSRKVEIDPVETQRARWPLNLSCSPHLAATNGHIYPFLEDKMPFCIMNSVIRIFEGLTRVKKGLIRNVTPLSPRHI